MIPAEFIRLVEFETKLAPGTLVGPSRLRPHVHVRSALCRVMRDMVRINADTGETTLRFSLPQLGKLLGRDHSTICAALPR